MTTSSEHADPYEADVPCIGIFWQVAHVGKKKLVSHVVSLAEADEYGDFLTHPSGHYEVWESWQQAGIAQIKAMGLPTEIASTEYESHPRGRVVYNRVLDEFTIYADKRLQKLAIIQNIAELFGIAGRRYTVKSDSHYVGAPPIDRAHG
jgi:hypothetical protein